MSVKKIPAQAARVEVTVSLTEEEYERISTSAAWGGGGDVASYMKDCALGRQYRGC